MTIHTHLSTYFGLPVRETPAAADPPPESVAWRIAAAPYDESEPTLHETFEALLGKVDGTRIRALVVGWWGAGWEDQRGDIPVSLLAGAADRSPPSKRSSSATSCWRSRRSPGSSRPT